MTILGDYFSEKSIKKADVARKTGISSSRLSQLSRNQATSLKAEELYLIALAIDVEPSEILNKVCNHLKLKKVNKNYFINPAKNLKITYSTPVESLTELSDPTVRLLKNLSIRYLQDISSMVEKSISDNKRLEIKSELIQEITKKKRQEILDVAKKYLFQ